MNGKKLLLTGLSATLLLGAVAQVALAAPHDGNDWGGRHHGHHQGGWHRPHFSPEVLYVRLLKEFGNPGDTKLTKEEVKAGVDKIFDQIDVNHDGQITPGEYKTYRQAQIKQWKAEHAKADGDQAQNAQPQADQAQGDQSQNSQAPAADQSKGDQAQNDDNKGDNGNRHHRPHGRFAHEGGFMRGAMIFRFADTDQSGQISKTEAEDAMNKLFDRLDRNHDGVVNLDDMPGQPLL